MSFFCVASDEEEEGDLTKMTNVASNSSSPLAVNEENILEQVLSTRLGHKTRVGRTLSQRVHSDASSSSRSEGSTACVDPAVEEYVCRSYEQNLQMYESHRMQELLGQLHPNIQFPTITRPKPFIPPSPRPSPDDGEDDANDMANLGD